MRYLNVRAKTPRAKDALGTVVSAVCGLRAVKRSRSTFHLSYPGSSALLGMGRMDTSRLAR